PGPFAVGSTSYDDPAVTIPATGVWAGSGQPLYGRTESGTLSLAMRAEVCYPADMAGTDVPFSTVRPAYPVVLVMHGQSWVSTSYLGYTYLLEHLASHGFVAV